MYICTCEKKLKAQSMEKKAKIEIRVSGKEGNIQLTPSNYDIKYISRILQDVEDILFPENKKARPLIAYDIEKGSVRHIFTTATQTVIGFSAILEKINKEKSIDFLQPKTAQAIENLQKTALKKQYEFQIKTSIDESVKLSITPTTAYYRKPLPWSEAEFYFYGTLKDAGGKNKANIHLDTDDYGYIAIETEKKLLQDLKDNLLYKEIGLRAKGRQNMETGEID